MVKSQGFAGPSDMAGSSGWPGRRKCRLIGADTGSCDLFGSAVCPGARARRHADIRMRGHRPVDATATPWRGILHAGAGRRCRVSGPTESRALPGSVLGQTALTGGACGQGHGTALATTATITTDGSPALLSGAGPVPGLPGQPPGAGRWRSRTYRSPATPYLQREPWGRSGSRAMAASRRPCRRQGYIASGSRVQGSSTARPRMRPSRSRW